MVKSRRYAMKSAYGVMFLPQNPVLGMDRFQGCRGFILSVGMRMTPCRLYYISIEFLIFQRRKERSEGRARCSREHASESADFVAINTLRKEYVLQ